jgi:hypothetical protein
MPYPLINWSVICNIHLGNDFYTASGKVSDLPTRQQSLGNFIIGRSACEKTYLRLRIRTQNGCPISIIYLLDDTLRVATGVF